MNCNKAVFSDQMWNLQLIRENCARDVLEDDVLEDLYLIWPFLYFLTVLSLPLRGSTINAKCIEIVKTNGQTNINKVKHKKIHKLKICLSKFSKNIKTTVSGKPITKAMSKRMIWMFRLNEADMIPSARNSKNATGWIFF